MGDWFTDNAPPAQPQTQPQTHVLQPQAQASGDWFSQNAPTGPSLGLPQPGPTPTSQQTESAMKTVGRKALDYLPAVGATAGALLAPEGVLPAVGLAALGGAAGETARQGTLAATGDTEAPQSVGDAALNVGKSAAEQGAMELGGRLIAKPFEMIGKALAPERLYQSSLRPSLSKANLPKIDTEVATGLREGIPTSSKGLQIARDRIDALNDQIANEIANKSQQLGPVVQPSAVAQQVAPTRATFATQVNPQADLSAIDRATAEFMEKHSTQAPYTQIAPYQWTQAGVNPTLPQFYQTGVGATTVEQPLTLAEAQAEKQGTYSQLRGKYGELKGAEVETQKSLARGLKNEIVSRMPELSALNERDSSLIDLESQLQRFVGREGNKNLMGLSTPMAAAAGAAAEGVKGGIVLGLLKSALDNPEIKSNLAIALYKAQRTMVGRLAGKLPGPSTTIPTAIRLGQAVLAGRGGPQQ